MNRLGQYCTLTTWGESHGDAIGGVIDGLPAGLVINMDVIHADMQRRRPGQRKDVSARKESDQLTIHSGVYLGKTTGAPLSFSIVNQDVRSQDYPQKLIRPGHADATYLAKYGHYDPRGGGRSSARETAIRVAAASMIKQLLKPLGIDVWAYLCQVGPLHMSVLQQRPQDAQDALINGSFPCPDQKLSQDMQNHIQSLKEVGNSCGGCVGFVISGLPKGLGEPVYDKFEARLAQSMLSIPASKGFDIGQGFGAAAMTGLAHNDSPNEHDGFDSNAAGGLLGGITNGDPVYGRVAFKPTSSIRLSQRTIDYDAKPTQLVLQGRHDPCVAVRATVVVEAMCWLTIIDLLQPYWQQQSMQKMLDQHSTAVSQEGSL